MEQPTTKDFYIHLHQGNFQAALDLANDLQLDKDLVYKAQWSKQREERGPLLQLRDVDHLKLISDSIYVVGQCLDVCVNDPEVQEEIINSGQARISELTDPILKNLTAEPLQQDTLSEKEKTLLRTRYYLLKYSDRLKTCTKIWPSLRSSLSTSYQQPSQKVMTNDSSFANVYSQFRDSNLIALAIEFARSENNTALDAIFLHHGKEILPHRLFILSQIPETSDPSRFDLPHVTHAQEDLWLEEPWRGKEQDPVEAAWLQALIQLNIQEEIDYTSRLQKNIESTDYPASSKVIADWYLDRAYAADKIGLSNNALEMIRYAQVMGVTGIEDKVSDYEWLCKYIYVTEADKMDADTEEDKLITLDTFRQLSAYKVLEGLLSKTDSQTISTDLQNLALPWIEYCKRRGLAGKEDDEHGSAEYLLYKWLLDPEIVDHHLDWCCSVMEKSKPTEVLEDRIIKDDLELSRLILSIVYFTDGEMQYLIRLFECLPIFSELEEENDAKDSPTMADLMPYTNTPFDLFVKLQTVDASGLTQMMDTLQTQLGSAEILARYHAAIPLRWYLQEQSIESQRQLCIRMSSQAAGGVESGGAQFDRDDDWRELLDDMIRLNGDGESIFGKLDTKEIFEIFFSSLLRCGRFKLAKELILGSQKMLDINKAEKLVIDAEREFYDNATSGNMRSGSMKQAWECLKTLPPTTEIKKELNLIEATHSLIYEYGVQDRPGISLMPIQIRQSKNRLELIAKLINWKRDMYKHPAQVLELVQKLGYGDDLLAKVKALAMLASAALVEEDYMESYKLCQLTVEAARSTQRTAGKSRSYYEQINQSAWQICFNLGKLETFEDENRRLDVLSMAMALSPPENIHDVLTVWRKLDEKKPDQIALAHLSADNYGDSQQGGKSWQGLLQTATKQWSLGELLAGGEHSRKGNEGSKRKRDILRDAVGGWLF